MEHGCPPGRLGGTRTFQRETARNFRPIPYVTDCSAISTQGRSTPFNSAEASGVRARLAVAAGLLDRISLWVLCVGEPCSRCST